MTANRTKLRQIFKKREMITSLPLYYEGFLWKKGALDKSFQRYWSELRGCVIFFYSDEKDGMYTEKLNLQSLVPLDDNGRESRSVLFTLQLEQEEIQLKAESTETKIEWQGYIAVVSQLEVPTGLSLLPGQILQLQEILEHEKERQALVAATPESQDSLVDKPEARVYDNTLNSMPECYYTVSRIEAETLLERHPENGSLIIRPASNNSMNYSVSTLIPPNGKAAIKHYRVTSDDDRFILWLDNSITCFSLQEIVDYFIKATNGNLKPYLHPNIYSNRIENPEGQHKLVPHARVAPFHCDPELPRKLSQKQPDSPGARHKWHKLEPNLETRYVVTETSQQPLKHAPTHHTTPKKKEAEPSYMNDEYKKPPNQTAPQPRNPKQFTGDGMDSDELMQKLMKRRQQVSKNN
uniref:Signal-transducing adaptor protein 1 n=1 Tax=Callorhinchus milii TaxID=7868 RepID=A0A4W3JGZ5_CALMI